MTIDFKKAKEELAIQLKPLNEAEWIKSRENNKLLTTVEDRGLLSDRKLRLYVVACCMQIWSYLPEDRGKAEVETALLFVDGKATLEDISIAHEKLIALKFAERQVPLVAGTPEDSFFSLQGIALRASLSELNDYPRLGLVALNALRLTIQSLRDEDQACQVLEERENTQADYLRDLFGPLPFREIPIAPDWLGWNNGLIVKIANTMYENEDFGDFAILGDLLEEAGCQDRQILSHCRTSKPHIKGCWLLDLILGKS